MCFAPAFGDREESMGKINERCGGIDVGKRFLLCCVLTGAAHEEPRSQTRRFDATVSDLVRLREWLAAEKITHVLLIWLFQQNPIGCGSVFSKRPGKVRGSPYLDVRHGFTCGAEAEQCLERSHGCVTTIMAKDELIEIDLQLVAAHSMIGSDEPLLEIANCPIRQRHH